MLLATEVLQVRGPVAVAVATLAAAALFNPVRRRVQKVALEPAHVSVWTGADGRQ